MDTSQNENSQSEDINVTDNSADTVTTENVTTEPQAAATEAAPTTEATPAAPEQPVAETAPATTQPEAPAAEAPSTEAPAAEAPAAEAKKPSRQPSMEQIMESDEFSSYISGAEALERGALLSGVVVRIDDNTGEMLVDVGTKSEGVIAKNEVGDDEINVGDEIEVVVLRPENDDGHPVLSKRRADFERRWRELARMRDENINVEGTVREQVKGGLIVDLGVSAFVPASHVDARNRGDLSRFVGRTIPVRVIEIDRKKNKVIASHRLATEEDRKARKAETWNALEKDKIVEGIVRRITDFGAFIDLGGVDGLLHVREMAWSRVDHPENVVKKGQKLQVLVLDIDNERERVALGLKQLQSDPWKKVAKDFTIGQTVTGKILRIAPTCAFMEIAEGVEGIIPISEMSEVRINKPEDVLEVGQEIEARIKQLQPNQRRVTLSLRAAVAERERRETRTTMRQVNERATGGGSGSGGGGGRGDSGGGDDGGSLRLGDVFGQQLRAARDRGRERNEARAVARRDAQERALQAAEEEEWGGDVDALSGSDISEDENIGVIDAGVDNENADSSDNTDSSKTAKAESEDANPTVVSTDAEANDAVTIGDVNKASMTSDETAASNDAV